MGAAGAEQGAADTLEKAAPPPGREPDCRPERAGAVDCRSSGIEGALFPVKMNAVNLSHCARFVFLFRGID